MNRVLEQGAPGADWQPLSAAGTGHTVNTTSRSGSVDEYKDFEGRIVLKRIWETESKSLNTYYVYDDFGDLRYVIPLGVATLNTTAAVTVTEATTGDFHELVYAYRYDGRRRLIEKKVPGKGWEQMVYNKNDQLVQFQDAIQRATNKWTVTKYDAFGRVVMTGIHQGSHPRDVEQEHLMTVETVLWESRLPGQEKYANVSYPQNNFTPLTINYYDDYSFGGNDTPALKADNIKPSSKLKGLLTGQLVYQDDGSNPLLTIFYDDDYGRIIQSAAQNQLNAGKGTDVVTNTYSFTGELETSKRVHSSGVEPATIILTTNLYDHAGRLVETKKRIYSQNEITQSKLAYNEVGQLKQKDLHVNGSTVAQQIVYGYNERGWLSKINNPDAVNAKQVFGMELSYADKTDTYNGNIGTMKWNTKVTAGMTLQPVQTYTYSYDKLNRLSRGSYKNAGAAAVNKSGFYDEELRYDNMGNIDSLRRTNGSKTWSNNFKYTYSGHKLSKVTDAATPARTNSFAYDVNSNATTNTRLGITKIAYNYLNLPVKFTKGSENLVYKYNALGQKLTKELGEAKTDYVNGIQYKNGAIEFIQTEEGRILPSSGSYIYEYFLEDHLGNTRAVVDHSGTIKQIQDYYPFGLEMNQGNALNTALNLYKYNGKEKQVEMGLDQFDYGARFYDAEIGRWNVVDPLAEKYFSTSPFSYVVNAPTNAIDPDGKQIIFRLFYSQEEKHVDLTYKNGAFYYAGGLKYDPTKGSISKTLDNLIDVFSKIEKSGDENLIEQLKTLETSENKHIMSEGVNKGSNGYSSVSPNVLEYARDGKSTGTKSSFSFFDKNPTYLKTPLTVFTHEMRHMYDYQIGNMKDNTKKENVKNPAEIRAVHNENIIRKIYNIPLRNTYGGEKFDLNLLRNPPNLIYKSNNKTK